MPLIRGSDPTDLGATVAPDAAAPLASTPVEGSRVAALRALEIMDTAAEADFEQLVQLAAAICEAPMAGVSLVDADRQWFKARVGLAVTGSDRADAFCSRAIEDPDRVLVVPDTTADPSFATNPFVREDPFIRFYAGAPLVLGAGAVIGTLCVFDQQPRVLSVHQQEALRTLARQVTVLIESRDAARRLVLAVGRQSEAVTRESVALDRFRRTFMHSAVGMVVMETDGRISQCNTAFAAPLGLVEEDLVGRLILEVSAPHARVADADVVHDLLSGRSSIVHREKTFVASDGRLLPALVTTFPLPRDDLDDVELLEQVEWVTDVRREEAWLLETRSTVDAIVSVDAADRIVTWNEGAVRMFGRPRLEMLGTSGARLFPDHLLLRQRGTGERPLDVTLSRSDGSGFPAQVSLAWSERGGRRQWTAIARDVSAEHRRTVLSTLRREAATIANDSADLPDALARLLPVLARHCPATAVRVRGGGGAAAGLGWPAGLSDLPQDPSNVRSVPVVLDSETVIVLDIECGPSAVGDADLDASLALVAEELTRVEERARAAALLTAASLTDPLTGLANRRQVLQQLEVELLKVRSGARAAVMFVDLDRFKAVNDSLGHDVGDEALRVVAARLGGLLRDCDTLARLGGDEFFVVCPGLPEHEPVDSVAERLLQCLTEPLLVDHTELYLGASIGVAVLTAQDSPERAIRHADIAMYRAKAAGGHRHVTFTPDMDRVARRGLELTNSLYAALRNDEFVLHYQPLIRLQDGVMVGVEALARWARPGIGLIPPDDFIPLAEKTGLIVPLGELVLRTAVRQLATWRSEDAELVDVEIAVNVAAAQLRPELCALTVDVLASSGLPPALLTLEITEGAMLQDLDGTSELLTTIRRLGVRVALDDFGTGYSSLSHLERLPLDVIKIDRSFVAEMAGSPRAGRLVDVILDLAGTFGLRVVAEGVEDAEQAEALRARSCDLAQGYLYSRPVPAAALPQAMARIKNLAAARRPAVA